MNSSLYNGLNDRQKNMLDFIADKREIRVAELKEKYPVTEMTIRRDLEKLEETGAVKRTFGGAIFVGKDIDLNERVSLFTEEKSKIGSCAAALIRPGESVFIDGGTTTLQVAKYLPEGWPITVVTNSLHVAAECSNKRISVLMLGGMLLEATKSLVGPIAVQSMGGMAFDRIFLGATGLTVQHGFCNSNIYEAEIKQQAIRQASETNIVLDHTKFGSSVLISFATLAQVDRIISDEKPDEELDADCQNHSVEVLVAK